MVFDVLRGYLHVASGLSDVTKQRARDLAEAIVVQGMDVTSKSQEQVQSLTDELVESSRTNRELLIGLIRTEIDRTVSRMGFVREDELAAVRQHVHRLELQIQKEHQRATEKAAEVVMGTAETSTSAARSAVGAASKTVSGVAGVMASGAAKMTGSATAAVKPDGARATGPKSPAPASEASTADEPQAPAEPTKPEPTKIATGRKRQAKKATAKKTTPKKTTRSKAAKKPTTKGAKATAKKPRPKKSGDVNGREQA